MNTDPQKLSPFQEDLVMLHALAMGCLTSKTLPVQIIELPKNKEDEEHSIRSYHTESGVDLRYCSDPAKYLLQIVGPVVPKPTAPDSTRDVSSRAVIHWEKSSPLTGVVELRDINEAGETSTNPVMFPETKKELIDSLAKLLIDGFVMNPPEQNS